VSKIIWQKGRIAAIIRVGEHCGILGLQAAVGPAFNDTAHHCLRSVIYGSYQVNALH